MVLNGFTLYCMVLNDTNLWPFNIMLWHFTSKYWLDWTCMVVSRGQRSKFIWSCFVSKLSTTVFKKIGIAFSGYKKAYCQNVLERPAFLKQNLDPKYSEFHLHFCISVLFSTFTNKPELSESCLLVCILHKSCTLYRVHCTTLATYLIGIR